MKRFSVFLKSFLVLSFSFLLSDFSYSQDAQHSLGDACHKVKNIRCGETKRGNTRNQGSHFVTIDYANCHRTSSSFEGSDEVYRLDVNNTTDVQIRLFNLRTDLDLFVVTDCDYRNLRCLEKSTNSRTQSENITISNARGTYYIVVDASRSSEDGEYSLSVSCEDDCKDYPSNCREITCTPRPHDTGGGGPDYIADGSCWIDCSFSGSGNVAYWKVGNNRENTTSKKPSFKVNGHGKTIICCYYYCNGRTYKCCKEVECEDNDDGGGCGGYCEEDNFSRYRTNRRIAEQSNDWRTWDRGREGSYQDARVTTTSTNRHILKVVQDNDVVYDLGNKRSGVHCFSTRLWIRSGYKGYFNIQSDYDRNQSGGYWSLAFNNGRTSMKHSSYSFNYRSNNWLEVHMKFDLDRNTIEMVCEQDGQVIGKRTLNYNGNIQMGGLNLFGQSKAEFYCDWVKTNCNSGGGGYFAGRQASNSRSKSKPDIVAAGQETKGSIKKMPFDTKRKVIAKEKESLTKSKEINIQ